MSFGVDYAFNPHPSISALKAAGVKFVCRYISQETANDANGKNLTPGEARALSDAGIDIVLVVEEGANRMLGGKASGVSDAAHADAVVKALGMAGMPIYFACDFDATPGQQGAINDYLDGAASVIGRGRVGIYGGYWPCMRAAQSRRVTYVWQTYAWSGSNVPGNPADLGGVTRHLFQYQNGMHVGGASVDYDKSLQPDFGQWPRPKPPAPVPTPTPSGTGYRWVADGTLSLNDFASSRKIPATHIVETSFDPANLNDKNRLAMALYLCFPGPGKPMPQGLVYYTVFK